MSTEIVAARMGAGEHALSIEVACIRFGITTELEKSHFIAQMAFETTGRGGPFTAFRESMDYSPERLMDVFGRHRITAESALRFGRTPSRKADQHAIANDVYGGAWGREHLGNTEPEDGWNFRGGGGMHLTGRENWTRFSMDTYGDTRMLADPERITRAPDAMLSAGWFWRAKGINAYARDDDVRMVTRRVNGGANGLNERRSLTEKCKRLWREFE